MPSTASPTSASELPSSDERVAAYYDSHASRWLGFGTGRDDHVIHRPVWAPGVGSRREAVHWVHRQLLEEMARLGGADVVSGLDLGCGQGATLSWLVEHGLGRGCGVTLSRRQVDLARASWRRLPDRRARRLEICRGDFCRDLRQLPAIAARVPFDLVWAIEAFAHAPDPAGFFQQAADVLRPGGRLVLVDDVLADRSKRGRARRRREADIDPDGAVEELRRGWHLASLLPASQVRRLARRASLTPAQEVDLTPWLRTRTLRDRLVALTVALGRPWLERETDAPGGSATTPGGDRWLRFLGGDALRRCLEHGLVQYRLMVWHR